MSDDPKVLFLDIECSDLSADIGNIICIGYKWAHESKVHTLSTLEFPGKHPNDDSGVLKAFEPVFNAADLVVHHFGDFYDVPFIQTRRLIHGMKPLANVKSVDTWRICKKKLKFGSNRLERVLQTLGCPYRKTPLDITVWAKARWGHLPSIKYILKHCVNDVLVLEWVYNKIRPVWPTHPRLYGLDKCPTCGSTKSRSRGRRIAESNMYQRRICLSCGATWKGPVIKWGNQ